MPLWKSLAAYVLLLLGHPHGVGCISTQIILPPFNGLWTFLAYDIGLEPSATVDIELYSDQPAPNTYVMMLTRAQWIEWHQVDPMTVPSVDGGSTGGLNSYLTSAWRMNLYDGIRATFNISAAAKDRYFIGIWNVQRSVLKIHGSLSLVNPGGDQLPLQDRMVPTVLGWTSLLFFVSCLVVIMLLALKGKRLRTNLHLLMVAALLLKGLVLAFEGWDRLQVARNGTDGIVGEIGWQLLDKVQTIVELMLFLLTALGWKFLRPTLTVTEVRFAVGISVISFYLGVFEVACTTTSTCSGYQLSRYILHSLCYLVVIVSMNFNLQMIHTQLVDAPATAETGKTYRKLHAYRVFRWVFLAFIVAPTAELFLKVSILPWDAAWMYVLLQQIRTWIIYVALIVTFRPEARPLRVFELTRDTVSDDEVDFPVAVDGDMPVATTDAE